MRDTTSADIKAFSFRAIHYNAFFPTPFYFPLTTYKHICWMELSLIRDLLCRLRLMLDKEKLSQHEPQYA